HLPHLRTIHTYPTRHSTDLEASRTCSAARRLSQSGHVGAGLAADCGTRRTLGRSGGFRKTASGERSAGGVGAHVGAGRGARSSRSEENTSELQSREDLV